MTEDSREQAFRAELAAFPRERTWLLPALQAAQRTWGWLPDDAVRDVARHLRLTPNVVEGVIGGYPMLRRSEPAATVVRVCTGVACRCNGGMELLETARALAGPGVGIEEADCLFCCAVGPAIEVGHRTHGRVAVADLAALVGGHGGGS